MPGQNIISDIFSLPFQAELVMRLVVSCIAGALVGYERKRRMKEAGMRTHIMVALAACLFAMCSKYGFFDVLVNESVRIDVSRIASNIVTGVCFLGAGMIFVRSKSISGLTTAAGIWAVSGIGLCFGCGLYIIGVFATLLIAIIQYALHNTLIRIEGTSMREITFVIDNNEDVMDEFISELKKLDPQLTISSVSKRENNYNIVMIRVNLRTTHCDLTDDMWSFVKRYPYVISSSL